MRKLSLFLFTLLSSISSIVYAGVGGTPTTPSTPSNNASEFLDFTLSESAIAASIYNVLFPVGITMGVIAIVGAGYSYMTSGGEPAKVQEASSKLTSAIAGIIFIALSLVILKVIIYVLL